MTDILHDDDTPDSGPIIAFDDLMFACTNLCELLEIENEALLSHDVETVKILTENKVSLSRLYEQAMQPMVTSPELAETLEPEQRDELMAVGLRLQELTKVNTLRLEAEMEAYKRVMDILADKAKKQKINATNYGRAGTFDPSCATGGSLTYNKSL
ncbi:flagellar protein FlgN [Paramagnetospirillum kuznetsovii]|uniref:Flagellar protein FlgN n=1 Tax=Paramagnetospirillum kuznetsovii TaxID=2053833 RepID=A0A364P0N7_9PROT|nr:flagellar protein FlgN [Paramagnetospirillum kuznetsovii]RAU22891.1 flagellar protein FlgN [Paramagnetospirillum kuznetsovii]